MKKSISKQADKLPRIGTVHESQLAIFQPTRRPLHQIGYTHKSPWGEVEVTGKLGQGHRDLLDAVMLTREKYNYFDGGRLSVLVDPYRVRKAMSSGRQMLPWTHAENLIEDMRKAKVTMVWKDRENRNHKTTDSIVALTDQTQVKKPVSEGTCRFGVKKEARDMLKITFGLGWTVMVKKDLWVAYDLKTVVSLRHGLSQAVGRFCLSHREVHESFEGICQRVGYNPRSSSALRKAKTDLLEDSGSLQKIGVLVNQNGSVHSDADAIEYGLQLGSKESLKTLRYRRTE